jgi:general secretion pathway protein L
MARQQDTAALYAASLARAKVDAEAAIALRRQVETLAAEAGWLAERKRAAPSLVALLDTLTRLVPDGTWLNRLDMDGKTVRLSGSSPAASTLIGLIENAPQFEKVRFLAPVTRDARLGVERFTLSAGIVGSKPSPKAPATKGKTR